MCTWIINQDYYQIKNTKDTKDIENCKWSLIFWPRTLILFRPFGQKKNGEEKEKMNNRFYLLARSPPWKVSLLAERVSPWPSETPRPKVDTPCRPSIWPPVPLAADETASCILPRTFSTNSLVFPIFVTLWQICCSARSVRRKIQCTLVPRLHWRSVMSLVI